MIYTTGTIAGSGSTLTGTGTNFTAAGTLIRNGCTVIVLTSPVQVFQITGVTSATQLTVLPAVNPAIPAGTRYAILLSDSKSLDGFSLDLAETFGIYQRNMGGFADVMTGTGNVTITINGVAVTVPAQKSLAQKENGAVPISQGGTGQTTLAAAKQALGSDTVNGMAGGTINGAVRMLSSTFYITAPTDVGGYASSLSFTANDVSKSVLATIYSDNYGAVTIQTGVLSSSKSFQFGLNGNLATQGNISCVSLTQTSDADKKKDVLPIKNALSRLERIDGVTFNWIDSGLPSAGVIAQKLLEVLPEAVGSVFEEYDQYETIEEVNDEGEPITVNRLVKARDESKRSYTVEYSGVVALCVQAIKELKAKVETLEEQNRQHANMAAFLQSVGFDPDTDYTEPEPEPENK